MVESSRRRRGDVVVPDILNGIIRAKETSCGCPIVGDTWLDCKSKALISIRLGSMRLASAPNFVNLNCAIDVTPVCAQAKSNKVSSTVARVHTKILGQLPSSKSGCTALKAAICRDMLQCLLNFARIQFGEFPSEADASLLFGLGYVR